MRANVLFRPVNDRTTHADMHGDSEAIDQYLAHCAHLGQRPSGIKARRWALLRVQRAVGDLFTATEDDLYAIVSGPTMGADARACLISHLRGFYRYCLARELIDHNPSERLQRPRRPRRLPRPMPELELRVALERADEPIRSWLYLAAYGGLRCCEIAPLRGEDRLGDVLLIREQKGGDQGSIPIGPTLDIAIAHLPRKGWWFERWDGQGGPISPGQLQRHANRFLHDIGLERTMHTLRHRYISRVYEASGRDLRVTQDLARHRSIMSTVGYTFISPDRGADVVAQLV